jgi:hemolysin III
VNIHSVKAKLHSKFSLPSFIATLLLSISSFYVALALITPSIWSIQVGASLQAIFMTFLIVHFVNAFVEFFFHRYVLHAPLVPFFSRFYKQHTLHHALTHVAKKRIEGESGRGLKVQNKYPIKDDIQHTASFFPWYAFLAFGIFSAPFLALAQWLLPEAPIFLAGFSALAWSLFLYEVLHALEHWPLEKWQSLLEHKTWGRCSRALYSFHLRHHADIRSNEAISGFFGLPVADLVFGTLVKPRSLYKDGTVVGAEEFKSPKPRFISWLDRLAEAQIRARRNKEASHS